jgi:hypothetical protein
MMIIKLKIRQNKKINRNDIYAWVQRHEDFKSDIEQIFQFFQDQLNYKKIWRFHKYYKITSENPAIMISFISTIQDLIPEIYFKSEESIDIEEYAKN